MKSVVAAGSYAMHDPKVKYTYLNILASNILYIAARYHALHDPEVK